ncbi:phosphate signaling complex protein PhoU [Spiroplasma endosymbiont of Amphibalanus improvisus]|uniref:phosphate signaling complex protein PhoU n=1 Tax=Spiroplasma endosymbiont of Amphibalanus improvisus TaxID=3066327 RepID=UPI00313CA10E
MNLHSQIDNDLKQIKNRVIEMMDLTIDQYLDMQKSLQNQDKEVAQKVIDNDKLINRMERNFIEICTWKIIKQQLKALDLKIVINRIIIIKDIERIADFAKNICRYFLQWQPNKEPLEILNVIVEKVIVMLSKCREVLESEDIKKIKNLFKYDDVIDDLFHNLNNEIIQKIKISKDTEEIKMWTKTMSQLKYIERTGDNVINILEILVSTNSDEIFEFEKSMKPK